MGVKIIAGSTADTFKNIKERLITVPLMVSFGKEEFIDGVTITHEEFYKKLIDSEESPVTSQPSPQAFRNEYEKIIDNGDTAVVITVSSKLSGTYQSAIIGAEGLSEGKIFVVDSKSASIGEGVLCELALRLVDEGKTAEEIVEILEKEREKLIVVALLDTLEYLLRGGRISKTSAMIGKLLSIKVVIAVKNGEIVPLGKARGIKKANNLLSCEIQKSGGVDFRKPLLVGYTGLDDENVKRYISDAKEMWEGEIEEPDYVRLGSVIGTHAGPGALGVAYFSKDKN